MEHAQRQTLFILAAEPANASWLSAAAGLLKTARQEQPGLNVKLIRYPTSADAIALLRSEMQDAKESVEIRYDATGDRHVREWLPITLTGNADAPPMASGSVIWITGGLGGIGTQLVRELGRVIRFASSSAAVPRRVTTLSNGSRRYGSREHRWLTIREM